MTTLYNVEFLIKRKNSPEHASLSWDKYVIYTINIPHNIIKEHDKCNYSNLAIIDLISAYLLGWFYKYNEDILHIDDIEIVLVNDRSFCK
jgi:hypothetical protein